MSLPSKHAVTSSSMSHEATNSHVFLQVRQLFEQVAELPADERDRVLRGGNWSAQVVDEVRDLLAVEPDEHFEESRLGALAEDLVGRAAPETIEPQVGPYHIVRRLGEGGMGVVFLARQDEPIERVVALKVVRAGVACESVLQRFERERRALARMDHDGIAKVLDAGTTEAGRPYFAMEYVDGEPIHSYCDRVCAGLEARLQLFARVCDAVHHAHQKGVLHRDLKPSNILVEDGLVEPRLKVIDFGLARALEQDLDDGSARTIEGTLLGTPEYMAPEQARGELTKVTVLSDVYSLGVVLYQLLTGSLPIELGAWSTRGFEELRRRIDEEEPVVPSRHTGTTPFLQHAGTSSRRPPSRSRLRELDWVVMRALEKEPARRYDSVRELGEDVERFLEGRPLVAGPPGLGHRLRKTVRRHRIALTIAAGVLVSVVLGGGFSLSYAWEAQAQQERGARVLDEFEMIASVVELENARMAAQALRPAWPEERGAIDRWFATHGRRLPVLLERVESTLCDLEQDALPWSDAERDEDRAQHPQRSELEQKVALLEHLRRGRAIRDGALEIADRTLSDEEMSLGAQQLEGMARARLLGVRFDGERIYGDEEHALALAREAFARVPFVATARTFAWALHVNGRDDEAVAFSGDFTAREDARADRLLEQLRVREPSPERARRIAEVLQVHYDLEHNRRRLMDSIAAWTDGRRDEEIRALTHEIEGLRDRVSERRTWRFQNPAWLVLHRTLVEARDRLRAFLAETVPRIEVDRTWANGIEAWTLDHPRAPVTWEDASAAIAKADDVVASRAYAVHPLSLRPQIGLVPIGMNPVTKLWEFYHLRSAWDAASGVDPSTLTIPRHDERGLVPTTGGIVFVLVPGGTFVMGMPADADIRFGNLDEVMEHELELDPFFIARHELTRAQWLRLAGGEDPSFYVVGQDYHGIPGVIEESHPVENVSWDHVTAVLAQHGLRLPTEAQWEYATRAGTRSPWFTGDSPETLAGFANLLDRTAETYYPGWGSGDVTWDDGYAGPAPVGTFGSNPWGLFDVYGNVFELCACGFEPYTIVPARGDGMRAAQDDERVVRGGHFSTAPRAARSGWRYHRRREERAPDMGARAARSVR
ncbi:MAG: SUMF1/EgtB/PvdO family nonheme iron enzyme [Planctomycetes bacterium]|nr:SUMF1/EgtB/PvdO family nonheme iron enzyme [Planctomycetota bacterium]